ncbi:MAG TPA: hypothetical protein PK222_01720 [Bacteroidales bacterium]|nr:hypothetical protein [Bacteroidales bacterium]HPC09860.1 hypothetical protein [archaeon]HRT02891.1 hypothetical protein [Candidatus Diapherotrites archaeon]
MNFHVEDVYIKDNCFYKYSNYSKELQILDNIYHAAFADIFPSNDEFPTIYSKNNSFNRKCLRMKDFTYVFSNSVYRYIISKNYILIVSSNYYIENEYEFFIRAKNKNKDKNVLLYANGYGNFENIKNEEFNSYRYNFIKGLIKVLLYSSDYKILLKEDSIQKYDTFGLIKPMDIKSEIMLLLRIELKTDGYIDNDTYILTSDIIKDITKKDLFSAFIKTKLLRAVRKANKDGKKHIF